MRSRMIMRRAASVLVIWLSALPIAHARQPQPEVRVQPGKTDKAEKGLAPPEISPAVQKMLDAEFLTPEERKNLRVFHGVWTDDDLDTPQRRAAAALIRGAYDDPALSDASVQVEDRAEGLVIRGELEDALKLLTDIPGVRAARLRAQALDGLGRPEEAATAVEPVIAALNDRNATPADQVEGVRGLLIRARVAPQKEPAGGDYNRMESILLDVSQKRDRLYWPALVAEAELLYEKNKTKPASDAAMSALSFNPRCARAWTVLGRITVDQFNFDGTEKVASELTTLLDSSGDGPVSVEGAELLARARLRQNDADGAAEALRPAIERYPKMRSLLAVRCAATALTYDFDRTDTELGAFDALSPNSALALLEVGKTLSEARQYAEAETYLDRAAERAPFWVEPESELGLMSLQSGRDAEGLKDLRHAKELDPFNTRVSNTLSLAEELARYQRIESAHFIIRYAAGQDEVLATDMVSQLENMYKRVTGKDRGGIDYEPKVKTVIDLMPNQRWFAVRIAGVTRIHTMAASTGPTIAMEAPREGPGHMVGTYDWLRVVRHEFTHTVTLGRTKNRIPHWFTEAAAVYMEDSPRDYPTCQLLEHVIEEDSLFDFSEINLAFIRPKKPTDRQQAYAQGHWMYQYMLERWGARAPLDLMDRYAAGEREDNAMKAVLGLDQPEFLAQFKDWAGNQLTTWGMGPQTPSLKDLFEEEAKAEQAKRDAAKKEAEKGDEGKKPEAGDGAAPADAGDKKDDAEPPIPEPTIELVNGWLEKYPTHPDVLELAVRLTLEAADQKPTEEMIPLFERYAKARPVDPLPHKMMVKLYTARGAGEDWSPDRAAKAVPHLEYLDAREQGSPTYAAELARAYLVLGELDKAAAKAERARTIAPYDAGLRELAATVALTRKDYATAEREIIALTKLEPDREIHRKRLEAVRKLKG